MGAALLLSACANTAFEALGIAEDETPSRGHVYLLRGLFNVFSTGMDDLGDKLNRRSIKATIHSHTAWRSLAEEAVARYQSGRGRGPIVIIGHSIGADSAVSMAERLNDQRIPVALVIAFDPVRPARIPPNVGRVLNLRLSTGLWWGAEIAAGTGSGASIENVDLAKDADVNHMNMDKVNRLHDRVILEVMRVMQPGRTQVPDAPGTMTTTDAMERLDGPAVAGSPLNAAA